MDFRDSAQEASYRAAARAWLARAGADFPRIAGRRPTTDAEFLLARRWQALKAAAGYACIDWPAEWGGGGGSPMQRIVFEQEESAAGLRFSFFNAGLGICVPTIAHFADPDTRARFVSAAVRGSQIWCQLFSEPSAGSDLAAITTRATLGGDRWRIRGQKVWTSYAQYADFGLLLARSRPEVPKHRGLTMFWVDMHAPGVEVRPIRQMSGDRDFNEVFLDLEIPDSQRVGPADAGWTVTIFALMNERAAVSTPDGVEPEDLLDLAHRLSLEEDPFFQARLADWYITAQGLRWTRYRTLTALARGQTPGPENSIGKLVAATQLMDVSREGLLMQGEHGYLDGSELPPQDSRFQRMFLWSPGYRLGGGTDEMLRTIIAEKVLGLPSEPKADHGKPFNSRST